MKTNTANYKSLVLACKAGNVERALLIIKNGYDVKLEGEMPFLLAATNGFIDIVKCFVDNGMNPAISNNIALIRATQNKHLDIVQYLVKECSLNVNIVINISEKNTEINDWANAYKNSIQLNEKLIKKLKNDKVRNKKIKI